MPPLSSSPHSVELTVPRLNLKFPREIYIVNPKIVVSLYLCTVYPAAKQNQSMSGPSIIRKRLSLRSGELLDNG